MVAQSIAVTLQTLYGLGQPLTGISSEDVAVNLKVSSQSTQSAVKCSLQS